MAEFVTQFGEAYAGTGVNAAHLNTVLGLKGGPVESAWVTALATPREGHVGFVVVAAPNVPLVPMTLFVNKATVTSDRHAATTWGAGQLGVASGVTDALHEGVIDRQLASSLLLITAVWIDPMADDDDEVYRNNRQATLDSLRRGVHLEVTDELLERGRAPFNGYFRPQA
ncbi:MAG: formaldehyde-activating enzyme [Acidobacteria bacterium]|nr:formaldehyde-activating enzyme [Acidobacteriota bacterium]